MITRKYKIADKIAEVNSIYEEVHEYCSVYQTDLPADYSVTTTQADIDFELEKSAHEDEIEGIPIRHFSDSYLEELAVYRKTAEKMIDYDTIHFHGSVIAVDGVGGSVYCEKRHRKIHSNKTLERLFRYSCYYVER